ncbi:hypothetical protein MUN89_00250 [Halobacillus salinarum]|uniref:Uncharacterized protein n=1 Tax=Halobacillus salinarum TaxID=2932257 RepID=A0ABY4EKF6_9BACI|nr:hypothetical protein [Halobacillus salinarum]UOQ44465.1 hypothetical protein MUN89_00250 [Halobacillus salinarum]
MTLLHYKARELFEKEYQNSPEAKEAKPVSTGVKKTRSGKILSPFRKNKRK